MRRKGKERGKGRKETKGEAGAMAMDLITKTGKGKQTRYTVNGQTGRKKSELRFTKGESSNK